MATRKLRVEEVKVETKAYFRDGIGEEPKRVRLGERSTVTIEFNRKLTALEVSGVCAVLEGEIK